MGVKKPRLSGAGGWPLAVKCVEHLTRKLAARSAPVKIFRQPRTAQHEAQPRQKADLRQQTARNRPNPALLGITQAYAIRAPPEIVRNQPQTENSFSCESAYLLKFALNTKIDMIDLGSTDFILSVPSLPETELERLSDSLFDTWESFVERSLAIPDYSLLLQVEEGSIKGLTRMGALLGAVYFGVGNYGSFISGLNTINEQLNASREYLAEQAMHIFSCSKPQSFTKKRGGSLSSLQRIFVKVQKGELTPDEAVLQAEAIIGEELETEPRFQRDLEMAIRNCSLFPEQLTFQFSEVEENILRQTGSPKRPIQPSRPRPPIAPTIQFRVEVWRESKGTQKKSAPCTSKRLSRKTHKTEIFNH